MLMGRWFQCPFDRTRPVHRRNRHPSVCNFSKSDPRMGPSGISSHYAYFTCSIVSEFDALSQVTWIAYAPFAFSKLRQ